MGRPVIPAGDRKNTRFSDRKRVDKEVCGMRSRDSNRDQDEQAGMEQLVSTLVHGFRNPLSSIKMGLTTLQARAAATEADRRILDVSLREVAHLERMLKDLEEAFRSSEPRLIRTGLNAPVRQALGRAAPMFREKGVILEADLADSLPNADLDTGKVESLFLKLFLNALEASGPGCRVAVRTRPDPSGKILIAEVEDDGRGMPPGILERATEPFFSTGNGKPGLGLTAAERIAKLHGGTIEIVSEPGCGTTVTLWIPVRG